MTTDPTEYIFTVDGIKYEQMPKGANKNRSSGFGSSGGGGGSGSGFSGGNTAPSGNRGSISGFGNSGASNSNNQPPREFGKPAENAGPAAHSTRRYIYDEEEEDENTNSSSHTAGSKANTAAHNRASFQSPSNNSSAFGFDPFSENPAPAPKQSAAANLFNAFDEPAPAAPVTKAAPNSANKASFDPFGSDPFGSSSDPFATTQQQKPRGSVQQPPAQQAQSRHASVTATPPTGKSAGVAAPNFLDDDLFSAKPAATANTGFADFGAPTHGTPARRSSAIEIQQDFAGMSFAAPAPAQPQKSAAASLFDEPEPTPPPAPAAPEALDPWSAAEKLVNLDLSGRAVTAGKTGATGNSASKGPSLSSMMTSNAPHGNPAQVMGGSMNSRASFTSATPLMPMHAPPPAAPASNPWDSFSAHPPAPGGGGMGIAGGPMMMGGGGGGMAHNNNNMNSLPARGSFTMGNSQPMGMGGMHNNNNNNSSMMMGGGGGAMGGGGMAMGGSNNLNLQNTRGSFISSNPPVGGSAFPVHNNSGPSATNQSKSSLDALDWRM